MALRAESILLFLCCLPLTACGSDQGGPPPGAAVPVVVAEAKTERVAERVAVIGTLSANEMVEIQSEIDGIVEEIAFEEGQSLEKGKLLFRIDQEKLSASVAEAEANYELAAANLKRGEKLLKNRTISSKEYDQALSAFRAGRATLERTKQLLGDATITAPFDGQMGARHISPGQLVEKGQTLSSIVNLDIVKAEFAVPERYVSRLRSGLAIEATIDGYPGEVFSGKVFFVSPRIERSTRTVLVKASLPNEKGKLKAGMLAKISALLAVRENAVVVPESAVMLQRDGAQVFAVAAENKVELRPVQLGERLRGKVEIREGLKAGELVVSEGTQKIRPGVKVSFERPDKGAEPTV